MSLYVPILNSVIIFWSKLKDYKDFSIINETMFVAQDKKKMLQKISDDKVWHLPKFLQGSCCKKLGIVSFDTCLNFFCPITHVFCTKVCGSNSQSYEARNLRWRANY